MKSQPWQAVVKRRRIFWIVILAAVLVAGLAACSSFGQLPTLVPTVSLGTPTPSASPGPTARASLNPSSVSPTPALVISYGFDPATDQMVPSSSLSGVTVGKSGKLWVVTDDAFIEYRRTAEVQPSGDDDEALVAHKVVAYKYDDLGRRVGWTVTWPQGPTDTLRLVFLYEGLVAVGERIETGGTVTTTYYPWATQDRNTTVDTLPIGAHAPITDVTRYDARCQAALEMDCVTMMAIVTVSEASVGNTEEQRAVAWTFRNRLDRGLSVLGYAFDRTPDREWYFDLAREVLTSPAESDVTKGATHFFSPRSMPHQGEEGRCKTNGGIYDCAGGLIVVEDLQKPAYAPFWHLLYEWLPVQGIRKTHFLFYRIPPIQPRIGQ